MTAPVQVLTTEERATLYQLEAVVRQSWQEFITVGEALSTIRDQRLYRAEHRTFGAVL